ncbi:MAG: hypothetical protein HOW71_05615, partial [Nonomuraea sp.]|nr:hypothetical protein [Nonomuraea sp.]
MSNNRDAADRAGQENAAARGSVGGRAARVLAGVLAGMVLGVVELVFLCVAWPASLAPAARPLAR